MGMFVSAVKANVLLIIGHFAGQLSPVPVSGPAYACIRGALTLLGEPVGLGRESTQIHANMSDVALCICP
jgi:hypothetical protein